MAVDDQAATLFVLLRGDLATGQALLEQGQRVRAVSPGGLAITSGRPVMTFRNAAGYTFAAGSEVTAATDTGMLLKSSGEENTDARLSGRTNTLDLGIVAAGGGTATAIDDFYFGGDGSTGYMLGSMGMMLLCPNTHRLNETKMRAWMKNRFNLA